MKRILLFVAVVLFYSIDVFAIGLMLPTDSSLRPFDIEYHRASVEITNSAAVTTIQQSFRNYTNRPQEAVFVFPIPDGGTVSDFSLWIDGKKVKGAVLEKGQARSIYESIVNRVEDPGLVEYIDGRLFKASIFPIPPNSTQKLEIKFGQVLEKVGGMYRYVYPLSAGRDFVTAKSAKDFTLSAKIGSVIPITNVYSPSHNIGVHRKSDRKVIIGTESMNTELDRDFELFVSYSKQDIGMSVMVHDPDGDGGEPGYFMVAIAPRVEASAIDEAGQTFTFVMDTSGSMAGEKIKQARKTLAYCIDRLRPQDNFNVIRFSTDVEPLFGAPVRATGKNKQRALGFAKELAPAGGTAIGGALELAMEQKVVAYQNHQVIFVTDGQPTIGNTDPYQIRKAVQAKRDSRTRVFAFGVGYDVNTLLLDSVSSSSGGRSDYVRPNQNMEVAIASLYDRISAPVLSNVKIDFGESKTYDMYPNPVPNIFKGDQIVIFGRYKTRLRVPIVVSGTVGRDKKSYRFGGKSRSKSDTAIEVALSSKPMEFLPKLWASRKVGFLLDNIRLNGERPELKNEVISLAKTFGLVTPYTSYLAVDDSEFKNSRGSKGRDFEEDVLDGNLVQPDNAPIADSLASRRKSDSNKKRKPKKKVAVKSRRPSREPMPVDAIEESESELGGAFDADGFGRASGEGAVRNSEKTQAYKDRLSVSKESAQTRRFVSNRTFVWKSQRWQQSGVKSKGAKTIVMYSKAYFALLKKHPELKRISANLGSKVIVKLGKRVYRFVPAKK